MNTQLEKQVVLLRDKLGQLKIPSRDGKLTFLSVLTEAAWPSGQRVRHALLKAVLGSSSTLTTSWICLTVALSSNPQPLLEIAIWFAPRQLAFLTMLCSI